MKSRPPEGGAAAAAAQRKKRNQQRLGGRGGGLSLEAFANAKSNATGYNPALIKVEDQSLRRRLDLQPQAGSGPSSHEEATPMTSFDEGVVASPGGANTSEGSSNTPFETSCQDDTSPSMDDDSLEVAMDFPDHGIEWPLGAQSEPLCEAELMIDIHISNVRTIMRRESPPPIEAVRDVLRRTTLSYHLMGLAKDLWMNAVEAIWDEMRNLHETAVWEANNLKICQLEAEISTMNNSIDELSSQIEAKKDHIDALVRSEKEERDNAQILEETVQSLLHKITELLAIAESRAKEAEQLRTETSTLLQQKLNFEETITVKRSQVEELKRKKPRHL